MKVLIMGAPSEGGYRAFGKTYKIFGGGWVENLINSLKDNTNIQIAVCFYATFAKELQKQDYCNVKYYALPERVKALKHCNSKMVDDLRSMVEDFKPEVVHIIGTEREHDLRLAEIAGFDKTIVSITGLTSICAKHYFGGIDRNKFRLLSIGDIYRRGGPIRERKRFIKWGSSEQKLLSKAKYVMGRTTWDYACVKQINPNVEYIHCGEILNPIFKEYKWDLANISRHRIFVSQATYPLKGFHKLLEAFPIILQFHPDSEIVIAGANVLDNSTLLACIKRTTYAKYLQRLIKKLKIPLNKIKYTGLLETEKMLEQYLKANVFVLPSAIENSPNSLGEAMSLGMPCVASCVGGVQDMMRDKIDGYIYPYDEPYMLAHYICEVFKDDDLALSLADSARRTAFERFDSSKVTETTINAYKHILSSKI